MKKIEMIKEIKQIAKNSGLTFRQSRYSNLYVFTVRHDKNNVVLSNCTLDSAYKNCMSGYISSFDLKTNKFKGIA